MSEHVCEHVRVHACGRQREGGPVLGFRSYLLAASCALKSIVCSGPSALPSWGTGRGVDCSRGHLSPRGLSEPSESVSPVVTVQPS